MARRDLAQTLRGSDRWLRQSIQTRTPGIALDRPLRLGDRPFARPRHFVTTIGADQRDRPNDPAARFMGFSEWPSGGGQGGSGGGARAVPEQLAGWDLDF